MSQILNRIRDVDASNSEAVKEALTSFFQNLLKYKDIDCNRWLLALEDIINRFPKYCGTHRQTIETYLSNFLSSSNYYYVIKAAKCAHAVQQVRPVQEKAATAKSCWREQMATLCDTAHKLIDALFAKSSGMYGQNNTKERNEVASNSILQGALINLDSLSGEGDSALNKSTILITRLKNVLIFIQAMLVEIYPVAKPVQPQLILAVILQALSAPGTEDSANVTTIKIQALRTLDALIACLGSNLIPFSSLVFRFVMQTLKWSAENPSKETSKVRVSAYSSLSCWLQCLRVHRSADARAAHDQLANHIASDVTPTRHLVQLTVNAQPMKNLSKKARKRLANTMLKQSSIASHAPGDSNKNNMPDKSSEEVAVAALQCAETFLSVCGLFLKTTIHKQFQELLVRECFAIEDHTTDRSMCLLQALEACRKSCSMKVPPPTQYCLQLYSVLINSPQREVSKFCSQALLDIRLHLHCSPASLCFSLEEQTQKKKDKEEGRKRTTERNRAVLEKLLGIDWMNTEDPNTITIPDEPSAKRPRVGRDAVESDVTENVSISSDSVQSIDTSSDSDSVSDESIIEAVELPPESADNDDVVFEPDVEVNSIHNDPTQVNVSAHNEPQTPDEPIIDITPETTQGDKKLAIHDEQTQINHITNVETNKESNKDDAEVEKIMDSDSPMNIHTAKTQIPVNSDAVDGKSPLSMEVVYDYPNTGNDKVTVLEKMDDENLPSTNDTDDIHITCGQVVKSSQDLDVEKNKDEATGIPKVNGVGTIENTNEIGKDNDASNITPNDKAVTVEDMLADFVDEVNEDIEV